MKVVFGSVKYLFKNVWYVLPYAILPAVFLALLLDYSAISQIVAGFFTGKPQTHFLLNFRALSLLRLDVLGGIYTVCAFFGFTVCEALMLSHIEKHMRLGKRTLSGVLTGFGYLLLSVIGITLVYFVLYEVWAVALSAVLFAVGAIKSSVLVCILSAAVFLLFAFALIYLVQIFYLWLPCKQTTGFGVYNAFLYSYRMMTEIRGKLLLSFIISFFSIAAIITGFSLLPQLVFRLVMLFVFVFGFLNFGIRMETAYFAADKLDREDLIRSYREL